MTVIENLNPRIQYNGPLSIDDELPITFPYTNPEDVQCISGEMNLQYNIDYTVFEQTLTLKKEVAEDQTITIYRATPLDQQAEFPQNNKFNSAKMNEALDKICMQQQEQEEVIARCMKVPISTMNFDGSIPVPSPGRALKINADATGFEMSEFDPDLALIVTEEFKNQAQQAAEEAILAQETAANNELESSRQARIATEQAGIATEQAGIATEQAGIATEQAESVTNITEDALENISTAKDDAIQTITTTKNNAIQTITTTKNNAATEITQEGQRQLQNIESTGFYMRDDKLYFINSNGEEEEFKSGGGGLEVGDIVYRLFPTQEATKRLLDGTLVYKDGVYDSFVNYMVDLYGDGTDVPAYFTTEEEWQASVEQYGVCGKFVYDSSANTIRLPKITGHVEGTLDSNALGDLIEAGLPNITGLIGSGNSNGTFNRWDGAFYPESTMSKKGMASGSDSFTYAEKVLFDASRSSSVYGNSDTVQPQAIKGYFYITVATGVKTDIEVDIDNIVVDLNGKVNTDLDNLTTTGSNIANWSVNVANCLTKIPQRIKVELANGIITLKAGSVVYVPNGFETDGVTPKFDEITINSDLSTGPNAGSDGSEVYLFYQTDGTLRYFNTSSQTSSGTTAPTGNYKCWYDITNNLIKHTNGTGNWEATYQSLPICICQSSSENVYANIAKIFNGFGRMALELWVDKGVKGLIPNGRNENKTLKNIGFTTNRVMTNRVSGTQTRVIAIDADHFQLPLLSDYRYDQITNHNLYKETTQAVECIAGVVETNNNAISRFQTKQPFQALDANSVNAWIVDSYTNGKSGYTIYSNNYCEQWGFVSNATSGSHTTITLLKQYASTDYSVLITYNTSSTTTAGGTQWAVSKMTTTNFAIGSQGGSYAWRAYGYLP